MNKHPVVTCWTVLETPEARLPYHEALVGRWQLQGCAHVERDTIHAAVVEGG